MQRLFYLSKMNEMLEHLKRTRAIADTGLIYAQNPYDKERYAELQTLALQMLQAVTGQDATTVAAAFPLSIDYPTAKVDVRAMVLSPANEILLVKEQSDGRWSLPGGWADIGYSAAETAAKECFEEAGLRVEPRTLLAVFDKRKHPHPPQAAYVYKMVFGCTVVGGALHNGHDVEDAAYFSLTALPPLSENRILRSQIELVYRKVLAGDKEAYFD